MHRKAKEEYHLDRVFCIEFTIIRLLPWLMRQVNSRIVRYRYPSGWHRTERSPGNDSALFIVLDRNFTIRIKDGGPWSSLNFKLKNTVGYIALLENSRTFPPAVCFTSRDKNQICEYSAPGHGPRVLDFAHWIFDRL